MIKKFLVVLATIVLCVALYSWWMGKAAGKPIENDELYSQTSSIDGKSYTEMFLGKIEEGNNTPLFYMLQKMLVSVTKYQTPVEWRKGQWGYRHLDSNKILRILPIFCMALGVALIFYYFAMHWHVLLGLYAVLLSLTSYMVLTYVCQARPYALWFLLTVVQLILVLRVLSATTKEQGLYKQGLIVVHFLLSFTVVFSVIQNLATCLVLWCSGRRQWKEYITLLIMPTIIAMFYYFQSPKYQFWFAEGFDKLLGASLPLDRLGIIVLALLMWVVVRFKWFQNWFGVVNQNQAPIFRMGLLFGAVIYVGCLAVLWKFQMGQSTYMNGFQVSNRYFMVLAPTGIFLTTMASYYLVVTPKGVLRKGVWILLALLFLFRVLRTSGLS